MCQKILVSSWFQRKVGFFYKRDRQSYFTATRINLLKATSEAGGMSRLRFTVVIALLIPQLLKTLR